MTATKDEESLSTIGNPKYQDGSQEEPTRGKSFKRAAGGLLDLTVKG
jgi:hypothetical protein